MPQRQGMTQFMRGDQPNGPSGEGQVAGGEGVDGVVCRGRLVHVNPIVGSESVGRIQERAEAVDAVGVNPDSGSPVLLRIPGQSLTRAGTGCRADVADVSRLSGQSTQILDTVADGQHIVFRGSVGGSCAGVSDHEVDVQLAARSQRAERTVR